MVSFHITEPHPSPSTTNVYHSGRGGAGNMTRVNPKNVTDGRTATGPASRINLSPPPSNAYFTSGRGGAGNMHRERERAMFSFDEELAQQERLREHAAPIYHIGRGGAGNLVDEHQQYQHYQHYQQQHQRTHRHNSTSSSASSDSEKNPVRHSIEGAWHKVSKQFTR